MEILKRYTRDFTLRLSASVISTIVSKVLLLPVLALMFSEEEYGLMLTIIGIESLISLVFGCYFGDKRRESGSTLYS